MDIVPIKAVLTAILNSSNVSEEFRKGITAALRAIDEYEDKMLNEMAEYWRDQNERVR